MKWRTSKDVAKVAIADAESTVTSAVRGAASKA